ARRPRCRPRTSSPASCRRPRSEPGTWSRPWRWDRRCGMKVDGAKLLEEFRRHLVEHNLPATQQRLAVAEAVFFAGEHLSAEEVGRRAARRVAVGTATIYRTLDLLVRARLAKEHDFGEGFKRDAQLANFNLVRVSSIFPPQCELVDREEGLSLMKPGQVVFAVIAESATNEPSRLVAASIGVAMPADQSHHGYISEHHSYGQNEI